MLVFYQLTFNGLKNYFVKKDFETFREPPFRPLKNVKIQILLKETQHNLMNLFVSSGIHTWLQKETQLCLTAVERKENEPKIAVTGLFDSQTMISSVLPNPHIWMSSKKQSWVLKKLIPCSPVTQPCCTCCKSCSR